MPSPLNAQSSPAMICGSFSAARTPPCRPVPPAPAGPRRTRDSHSCRSPHINSQSAYLAVTKASSIWRPSHRFIMFLACVSSGSTFCFPPGKSSTACLGSSRGWIPYQPFGAQLSQKELNLRNIVLGDPNFSGGLGFACAATTFRMSRKCAIRSRYGVSFGYPEKTSCHRRYTVAGLICCDPRSINAPSTLFFLIWFRSRNRSKPLNAETKASSYRSRFSKYLLLISRREASVRSCL